MKVETTLCTLVSALCGLCSDIYPLVSALWVWRGKMTRYGLDFLVVTARSPLVNWFANEAGIELTMQPPRPSNHPFDQIPFLTDDGGVEVFESGAILL